MQNNSKNNQFGIGAIQTSNKFDADGRISEEVKVDMAGRSDFVFKKEYNLLQFEGIEMNFTKTRDLENISNEKEV